MNDHQVIQTRAWPSKAQVSAYYRARSLADAKVGEILSKLLGKADLPANYRAEIEFWFEFYPEARHHHLERQT